MLDLTKTIYHTGYNAFKNNNVYLGTFNITGSTSPGTNVRSFNFELGRKPDLLDVLYNGATDTVFSTDPRPGNGWFHRGFVWALGNNIPAGYTNYPTPWSVYSSMSAATTLTITLVNVQQFADSLSLTPTPVNYKIVDYSVY